MLEFSSLSSWHTGPETVAETRFSRTQKLDFAVYVFVIGTRFFLRLDSFLKLLFLCSMITICKASMSLLCLLSVARTVVHHLCNEDGTGLSAPGALTRYIIEGWMLNQTNFQQKLRLWCPKSFWKPKLYPDHYDGVKVKEVAWLLPVQMWSWCWGKTRINRLIQCERHFSPLCCLPDLLLTYFYPLSHLQCLPLFRLLNLQ